MESGARAASCPAPPAPSRPEKPACRQAARLPRHRLMATITAPVRYATSHQM
jgi:hypothetical protein